MTSRVRVSPVGGRKGIFYFALYKKNGLFLHIPFHIGFSKDHTHTQLHDASNTAAIHLKSQVCRYEATATMQCETGLLFQQ